MHITKDPKLTPVRNTNYRMLIFTYHKNTPAIWTASSSILFLQFFEASLKAHKGQSLYSS